VLEIHEARDLPEGLEALRRASVAEGFRMVERLERRFRSGESRFDGPGEGLFAAREAGRLVGVGGVSRDPYLDDPTVGRLRHVYVEPGARRRGVGRGLVAAAVARGAGAFGRIRLRTGRDEAARFYCALGFAPSVEPDTTHVLEGAALERARRAPRETR
jgi:GNAT superfamily N-acetyltransferase